jgi:Zn-dependent M16 (insulinase) family peptidase
VLATIPSLTLADLDKENKLIPLTILEENGHKILYHDLFTNGLIYLDVGLNLRLLPPELLPFVQLFGQALLKSGTEAEDFVKLSQRIGRATGGITPSLFSSMTPDTPEGTAWLFLRGKATAERGDELLAILRDMLLTVTIDNPERFRQIVLEAKAQEEARIVPAGHMVADTRLRAHFNEADWAAEQMKGVSYLFFLRQLVPQMEQNWPEVLEKLETVRRILLNRQSMLCNVTLDEANWAQFQPKVADFLAALPGGPVNLAQWSLPSLPDFEGLTIPAQVNYVGKGSTLYEGGYTLHGSIAVITNYLRTTWLWERIRVQGGAYGSFCLFDQHSGVLNFLSYRDPNSTETLNIYDQTGRFLRQADLSQDELTKSIIGALGQMDAYQLPDAKGYTSMTRYLVGDTDAVRQRLRDEILSTTLADFKAFAEALEQIRTKGHVVILGSPEAIEQGKTVQGGEGNIIKVL